MAIFLASASPDLHLSKNFSVFTGGEDPIEAVRGNPVVPGPALYQPSLRCATSRRV